MKRLHLLRHAKSSWEDRSLYHEERPLAPRGTRASKRLAEHLARRGLGVDLVVCSPARRARDTLEPILDACGWEAEVRVDPVVYGADAAQVLGLVQALPEEVASALVVGHNPGLQDLARRLASEGAALGKLAKKYPTGALASLELEAERWPDVDFGGGRLESFVRPRDLG